MQSAGSSGRGDDGKSPYRRSGKSAVPSPFPAKSAEEIEAAAATAAAAAAAAATTVAAPVPERKQDGSAPEADASDTSGMRGKRKPAFDRDGPVEAVALQSDWQFWNIFSDVRTIGKGHFAKVKQVQHNESHEHFASKILDKAMADNDIEDLVRVMLH